MRLTELPKGAPAIVSQVDDASEGDIVAARLRDLGFVSGEPVRVLQLGPIGADPIIVQIGFTRFALRRSEASRVQVRSEATSPA